MPIFGDVLAEHTLWSRSGKRRASDMPTMPPIERPQNDVFWICKASSRSITSWASISIEYGPTVTDESPLTTSIISKNLKVTLECFNLRIPHPQICPQRIRKHQPRRRSRARQFVVEARSLCFDEGHGQDQGVATALEILRWVARTRSINRSASPVYARGSKIRSISSALKSGIHSWLSRQDARKCFPSETAIPASFFQRFHATLTYPSAEPTP